MVLLSGLFLVNCSEDSAVAPDGGTGEETTFDISYTTDSSRAVEEEITAAAGGTISATDSSGVVFTLEIPANALSQDETIRIIPLDLLTVDAPGVMLCSGCGDGDDCCVRGALFEPEGLRFDSLVTLTVEFPGTKPFPFDSVGAIMVFDSPSSSYSIFPTEVDTDARTLTARISHFSGYGTEAPDCTHLVQLYFNLEPAVYSAVGSEAIYYPLNDLIRLYGSNLACRPIFNDQCHVMCPQVNGMIEGLFATQLPAHIAALKSSHPAGEATDQSVEEIIGHYEQLLMLKALCPFAVLLDLESDMLSYIRQMAGTIYNQGVALCQQSECDDGEALLYYVLNLGARGYVTDAAFLQQVQEAYDNCCAELRVTLSASNQAIPRAVLSVDELEAGCITLTATVTDPSGAPRVGLWVDMIGDLVLTGAETDENGKAEVHVSSRDLGSTEVYHCSDFLTREVQARVYDSAASEFRYSNSLTLTFKNLVMTTTVDYTFSESTSSGEDHFDASGTVTGGGEGPANTAAYCPDQCAGTILFTYSSSGCEDGECGSTTVIGNNEVPGCRCRPVFDSAILDNGKLVFYLESIRFNSSVFFQDVTYETCGPDGCDTLVAAYYSWTRWPVAELPDYFEGDGTGTFEPWIWTETTETTNTSITITVGAHY